MSTEPREDPEPLGGAGQIGQSPQGMVYIPDAVPAGDGTESSCRWASPMLPALLEVSGGRPAWLWAFAAEKVSFDVIEKDELHRP